MFEVGTVKNGCGQSCDGTLKLNVSVLTAMTVLHVNIDSQKLKADQKFIGWVWPKMTVASLVMGL